jgi:hypothetical protein
MAIKRRPKNRKQDEAARKKALDDRYREQLQVESAAVLRKQEIPDGAQYARCDFCGNRHLIEGAGVGCIVCKDAIAKMPLGGKFILNALVQRITAVETLRTVDEQSIIRLQDAVEVYGRLVIGLSRKINGSRQKRKRGRR